MARGVQPAAAPLRWLRRRFADRRPAALLATGVILVAALAVGGFASGVFGAPGGQGRDRAAATEPDPLRTGWDQHEPGLSPRVVGGGGFGQLFSVHLDGAVLGQPVSTGQTLVVATEKDLVYGLDPVTGAVRWRTSLGRPVPNTLSRCANLGTVSGVTSTPVYDAATGRIYVVGQVATGGAGNAAEFLMVAIDPRTGAIGWKKPITGTPAADPGQPFQAIGQLQRPGLLLLDGWVYAGFGSRCEGTLPYRGYVVGVNTSTRALSMWTTEARSTGGASIWQSGSGLMSDGRGRIFLDTADGISPAPGPGTAPPGTLAESVVELAVQRGGRLVARDFFSPADAPALDTYDLEIGSSGPSGLPFGTRRYPHLLAAAGKTGRLLLLNRDSLSGRETGPGGTDGVVASAGPFGGLFGRVASFGGRGADYVYYLGQSDYLHALRFVTGPSGRPVLSPVASSTGTFGVASSSPVVTSNGAAPASAVVWVVNDTFPNAMLEAYDAVPQRAGGALEMKQIWSASVGLGSHFSTPAVAAGRVYVANQLGQVLGFGAPARAPLAAAPAGFGQVPGGGSGHANVTVTARATVTISAVSAVSDASPDPFTAGTPRRAGGAVRLPVTLSRGQQLQVPVTFAPAAPGGTVGWLDFTTNQAAFPVVSVSLSGTGTRPGLFATASSVQFLHAFVGIPGAETVAITNGGSTNVTVTAVRLPKPPFRVTGLPKPGTVLRPGESAEVQVGYAPAGPGRASSTFRVTTSAGPSLTEYLTGKAFAGDGSLAARPTRVGFGRVAVGRSVTRVISLFDPGQQPLIITSATALRPPFRLTSPLATGQPIGPQRGLEIPVEFSPRRAGPASATYRIRFIPLGGGPPREARFAVSGTAVTPAG
jgi:putative pyrroloquinoline-quinone binding quinoprotein